MNAPAIPVARRDWPAAMLIGAALAGAVVIRVILERGATAGPIAGAAFGAILLAAAVTAGWRVDRPTLMRLAAGVVGGTVLVAIPRVIDPSTAGFVGVRMHPIGMWVGVTIVVACAEEVLLRGALFDAVLHPAGPVAAVIVTSLAFALIHVPLYGWAVVPLDLAVGVGLGGLRLVTGGVVAPALAHAIADLATW